MNMRNVNLPMLHPEYFPIVPNVKTQQKVKALLISNNQNIEPQIVFDTSENIINKTFPKEHVKKILFPQNYHIYFSYIEQMHCKANVIATMFLRQKYMQTYGTIHQEVLCGNILIFGTINSSKNILDNKDHSVPYYLIEEVLRINDIIKK